MNKIPLLIGLLVATLVPASSSLAQTKTVPTGSTDAAYDQALLSSVCSLADAYLLQTRHTLETLSRTKEGQSAQWDLMERLVRAFVPPSLPQVLWFVQPDGTYYTSAEGLAGQNLSDRAYFNTLITGGVVCGDLVVSKSTGKKSVIIAVPVHRDGRVVGGMGASIFVDDLSQLLNSRLNLPAGSLFYALAPDGVTAFHIDPKLDFVDPTANPKPLLERLRRDHAKSFSGCYHLRIQRFTPPGVFQHLPCNWLACGLWPRSAQSPVTESYLHHSPPWPN